MKFVYTPQATPSIEVRGRDERYAVRRVHCVGRNYAAHAREMGMDTREPPFFFSKPADAIVANGTEVPYPTRTSNLHHEIELVVAIGVAGQNIAIDAALDHVFGYAVGNDLTRRDLQAKARDAGKPWDVAKGFDHSAPITAIHPASVVGHFKRGAIWLRVNGETRQHADLSEMIWNVSEIIAELSTYYSLAPGDLIFTGTPAGVGALQRGDEIVGGIDGLSELRTRIV